MKKILFTLLISLFLIPNVKADTNYKTVVLDKYEEVSSPIISSSISSRPFKNYGSGHLIFSLATYSNNGLLPLLGVYADTDTQSFTCNIGNFSAFDNGYQYFSGYSVDCPVDFGSSGLTGIIFEFPGTEASQRVSTSYNMTFVSDSSDDLVQLLSVVNQLYTDMGYGFSRQYIQLGEIYNRIGYGFTQSNELNQKILDALTESDKTINDIKNGVNDLNDNITNDNIDSSTGNDFFDSFTTNDNGGISAIVTAPLSAIEKMVSGTCTPIKGSYKGKEFSFPCGDTFWSDMQDVKQFLNIVLGGFLCYGILAKLYLLIDRLKDPEDDRVDVMKL